MPATLRLMVVCEEWRPADGDDLMVLLAVNYAVRGCVPPFGLAPGDRREMSPDEIREWVAANDGALVVAVLTADPPSAGERRRMDEEYLRATSAEGIADVREGRAALPERFSDDWVREVGPKCAAAVSSALERGRGLVVLAPAARLHALLGPLREAADLIEDDGERRAFVEGLTVDLRCGEQRLRVPVRHFGSGPEDVAARLFAAMVAANETEVAGSGPVTGGEGSP